MTIGEKIRAARKKANLTQKALGEKCQMPDSQIRQYELGMVTPKIEQIQRIAAALGCSPLDLLAITDATTDIKKEYFPNQNISNLQTYLESIGYTVLRESITKTYRKDAIDFSLSQIQKDMLKRYGYIVIHEEPYYIQNNTESFRLSEKEFNNMEKEILSTIKYQLWKYRTENALTSEENTNNSEE